MIRPSSYHTLIPNLSALITKYYAHGMYSPRYIELFDGIAATFMMANQQLIKHKCDVPTMIGGNPQVTQLAPIYIYNTNNMYIYIYYFW